MHILSVETLASLVSLTALETVLGFDNIIFLSILVGKLPPKEQPMGRRLGLVLALGMRICLLLTLSWLASLTDPIFTVASKPFSGRDLVLLCGGLFLVVKSGLELYNDDGGEKDDEKKDEDEPAPSEEEKRKRKGRAFFIRTLIEIMLMDIVFSLDSVITAVGIAPHVGVMIAAMCCSMLIMLGFAKVIGDFVERHPSMKVLALCFLVMVGVLLVAEGGGHPIPKAYVYFAMVFSFTVELLNLRMRKNAAKAAAESGE